MSGHLVEAAFIEASGYRLAPPRWLLLSGVLMFLTISVGIVFLASDEVIYKWLIVPVMFAFIVALLRIVLQKNYLTTFAADHGGIYFQSSNINKYFFIPWRHVQGIEKATFPINTSALRIAVDCVYYADAVRERRCIKREGGQCFIYISPELRNRTKVIEELEKFR